MTAPREVFGKGRAAGSTPVNEVQSSVVEIVGVELDTGTDLQFDDEEGKYTAQPTPSSSSVSDGPLSTTSSHKAKPKKFKQCWASGRAATAFAQNSKKEPELKFHAIHRESKQTLIVSFERELVRLHEETERAANPDNPLRDALNDFMSSIKEFELDMISPGPSPNPMPKTVANYALSGRFESAIVDGRVAPGSTGMQSTSHVRGNEAGNPEREIDCWQTRGFLSKTSCNAIVATMKSSAQNVEYYGKAYCDDDYQALFSTPCFASSQPLTKAYHGAGSSVPRGLLPLQGNKKSSCVPPQT
ncbi:hypothetical protein BJ742DRAFT_744582 [Cladochytrium replicatum]|nr:hypothetical protein BJ742DRAFT_744582 [Cladochytrium replicatum]